MTENNHLKSGVDSWNIALWISQSILALIYGYAGWMKLTLPVEGLLNLDWNWATDMSLGFIKMIGITELLGAFGVILPALLRILPRLIPLAALGMTIIQGAAISLHGFRGEFEVLPFNLFLLALSIFVIYGRIYKRNILPKNIRASDEN